MTESGRLCAFITKVKKGSLADTVGHLRPGDEVLEWNGRLLQGATFEEVYNIILESKPEPQVELVVSRPIGDIPRIPDSTHAQLESRKEVPPCPETRTEDTSRGKTERTTRSMRRRRAQCLGLRQITRIGALNPNRSFMKSLTI